MNVFGTEMHIITFVFLALEVLMFFYQFIYFLSRPDDRTRFWYLILLFLLILYNITGGLLPDKNISISIEIQNIIAYACGFSMAMYFPFYFYKAWDLKKLKFHAYYGIFVFLLLPFLIFFVLVYALTGDIDLVRRLGVIIPFFYSLSLFYSLTKAIIFKYNGSENNNNLRDIIYVYLAVLPWMSLTILTYFNASQAVEVSFTNGGLIVATVIFIKQTIKQSKEEYNKLLLSEKRLEELNTNNERKTNTLVSLAHETKTPLTLIKNYLEEFMNKYGEKEELKIIKYNINKLSNDIVNFFDLERFNKGLDIYDHSQISDFSNILRDKLVLFKNYCNKKQIELIENIESDIFIKADPSSIDRLMNNLIENAIKFTGQNGKIEIYLESKEDFLEFVVKDNGIGISPSLHFRIFEPYFQIYYEKKNLQGMGLGLSIVKKICDGLDGKINIRSNPDVEKGTEISIILPKHKLHLEDRTIDYKITNDLNYNFETIESYYEIYEDSRSTIMIVEDSAPLMNYLVTKLKDTYNILVASNAKEALEKLNTCKLPDLIISDVMMEKMDGLEFLCILSKDVRLNHIPVIFLTASSSNLDKVKGLQLGAIDYIQKPFSIDELSSKVDSVLENINRQRKAILNNIFTQAYNTMIAPKESLVIPNFSNVTFGNNCKKFRLTNREIEISRQIAQGHTYKNIGEILFISEKTVAKHIQNIFEKVGVNNKLELINKLEASSD